MDDLSNPLPVRRPSGHILIGGTVVADTLQCVHCGTHWIPQAGSGIERGFCMNCMGPVCGRKCAACVPMEKRLDIAEKQGHR